MMAKRLRACVQLALLVAFLCLSCSASGEQESGVFEALSASGEDYIDLYGAEVDEDEELMPMVALSDDDISPMSGSAASDIKMDADSESSQASQVWQEPENKMNLIRLFHGRYYNGQYNRINEVLIREVPSADLEANKVELTIWLERERARGVSLLNQATVEALEQLMELFKLGGQKRCDRDAYTIMFKNDQATGGRAHKSPSTLTPLRRIDAIVYQLFMNHAIECFNVYPENYGKLRETMDPEAKRLVETFVDLIIGDPLAVRTKVRAVATMNVAQLAHKFLSANTLDNELHQYLGKVVDERNGKLIVSEPKLREVVNKYIVEPCKTFRQHLGPDVFLPARFDAKMLMHEDRYKPESRLLSQFMHSYIHYNLCESLIKRADSQLVRNLSKYINSIYK